jgi:23S rRNA pseudouridine1911/1915/1917 synthase
MAIVPESRGKPAFSVYHTLERFSEHAYLEVLPETGRTHQIRVHMAFLGTPITGDRVYGQRKPSLPVDRHLLHASELEIKISEHASRSNFKAPLPGDFEEALDLLRGKR